MIFKPSQKGSCELKIQKYLIFKLKPMKKTFCEQISKSVQIIETILKTSLFTFVHFLQQEKGQLTSADDLHQMVGLCDDKNALYS